VPERPWAGGERAGLSTERRPLVWYQRSQRAAARAEPRGQPPRLGGAHAARPRPRPDAADSVRSHRRPRSMPARVRSRMAERTWGHRELHCRQRVRHADCAGHHHQPADAGDGDGRLRIWRRALPVDHALVRARVELLHRVRRGGLCRGGPAAHAVRERARAGRGVSRALGQLEHAARDHQQGAIVNGSAGFSPVP